MFLQHTRRIHTEYFDKCLASVKEADYELASLLRPKISTLKGGYDMGAINHYADNVGSGVSAFISTCVFIAWIGVGNLMKWNSNWWPIISTYTDLIGYADGFEMFTSVKIH
ncbi:low-affinity Fe(2+) transport protein [Basidiobolus ranarum]|uniref:Low-affinity Fe(2+) transport protein n=1 Tax=Basidiobolus ranarum TaxID=34480 RepID=A0ABR2WG16_9FUNG